MYNVTIQLLSHLDVLYSVEFSFKSNGSQWRSYMCIWSVYLGKFERVFGGSILSKAQNLSNIL